MGDSTPPPDFYGDLDGYLAWAAEHPQPNPQWCARHWAPCPVEGRPGAVAAVILAGEAFAFVPTKVGHDATALNSWFANQTTPTCCLLGDERMAWLWELLGRWQAGELCGQRPYAWVKGRRACFFERGHLTIHEFQMPSASVFDLPGGPGAPTPVP
jgi:hypothetical protein